MGLDTPFGLLRCVRPGKAELFIRLHAEVTAVESSMPDRVPRNLQPPVEFKGLLMGTASVREVERAARMWCAFSQYERVHEAVEPLDEELADLWNVDLHAHATTVTLRAPGASRGFLRLVETDIEDFEPDLKNGRAPAGPLAYEFLSRNVDEATARALSSEAFHVVGGPLDFDNGPAGGGFARAARVVAPGGFTCLFNTIKRVPAPRTLPTTELILGPLWNAPVTAADRSAVQRFYGDFLGMPVLLDGTLDSDNIRLTNGFPAERAFDMLVYGAGAPMQMIENEIHPACHLYLPSRPSRRLLRGNAIATIMVESLDPLEVRAACHGITLRGPVRPQSFPYGGRRVVAVEGPNREMLELLEVGA